jgi:hypothetical protein
VDLKFIRIGHDTPPRQKYSENALQGFSQFSLRAAIRATVAALFLCN